MAVIKNFFVEEDLKTILGWLGINYEKGLRQFLAYLRGQKLARLLAERIQLFESNR